MLRERLVPIGYWGLRYGSSEPADDISEIIGYRTAVRAVEIELGPADSDDGAGVDE
jgi:hypothetical protein